MPCVGLLNQITIMSAAEFFFAVTTGFAFTVSCLLDILLPIPQPIFMRLARRLL
jgi:hypothetical protein